MTANQLQYWRNVETERANRAAEDNKIQTLAEQKRANRVTEAETVRHNAAQEAAAYMSASANIAKGIGSLLPW